MIQQVKMLLIDPGMRMDKLMIVTLMEECGKMIECFPEVLYRILENDIAVWHGMFECIELITTEYTTHYGVLSSDDRRYLEYETFTFILGLHRKLKAMDCYDSQGKLRFNSIWNESAHSLAFFKMEKQDVDTQHRL